MNRSAIMSKKLPRKQYLLRVHAFVTFYILWVDTNNSFFNFLQYRDLSYFLLFQTDNQDI